MVNPNAFISLRGNRVHVAAFTREHLETAVSQVCAAFVVVHKAPIFRQFRPDGYNTELIVDLAASSAREKARLSNA